MEPLTLIEAIDAHVEATGLKPSTICQHAASNRKVYERLRNGGVCHRKTVAKILNWIAEDAAKRDAARDAA